MNIFISYSGETGAKAAKILQRWLESLLSPAITFFMPNQIELGTDWRQEFQNALDTSNVALLCVTGDSNWNWLCYEAGRLSKSGNETIIPVLFDVPRSSLPAPLNMYQFITAGREGFRRLVFELNAKSAQNKQSGSQSPDVLESNFNFLYPLFEKELTEALQSGKKKNPFQPEDQTRREIKELNQEINAINRKMDMILSALSSTSVIQN